MKLPVTRFCTLALPIFFGAASAVTPLALAQGVTPSVSALTGQFALYLTGKEVASGGGTEEVALAASFAADGAGHVTSGVLDKNSGSGLVQLSGLTGTYQLASTGAGSITLYLPTGAMILQFQTAVPLSAASTVSASITGASGTLLTASGGLGNASGTFSVPTSYNATLGGELAGGTTPLRGISTLLFTPVGRPVGSASGTVTGQALQSSNGVNTVLPAVSGTFSLPNSAVGRLTLQLSGLSSSSSSAANYVAYQGAFPGATLIFFSIDPHPSAPLIIGTNGNHSTLLYPYYTDTTP